MRVASWLGKATLAAVVAAAGTYILLFRVLVWAGAGHSDGGGGLALLVGMPGRAARQNGSDSAAAAAGSTASSAQPQPSERMIVIARTNQDTGWLHLRFGEIPVTVYQAVKNLTEHSERCPSGAKDAGILRARKLMCELTA